MRSADAEIIEQLVGNNFCIACVTKILKIKPTAALSAASVAAGASATSFGPFGGFSTSVAVSGSPLVKLTAATPFASAFSPPSTFSSHGGLFGGLGGTGSASAASGIQTGSFNIFSGSDTQFLKQSGHAAVALEILINVLECLSKKADDGDRRAAMMQLKEAGGFEAVVEHVAASEAAAVVSTAVPVSSYGLGPASAFGPLSGAPPLSAPAQTGSAEMFAAQLMSKHVAPFLVSAMSDSAAAVVVGAVRQHLGSKKRPVIEAYVEAHVIAELLKLLSSPQSTVREDSLGCLVIVAASSSSNRDAVIALGALASLAELIAACSADANERGVLRTSVTLLKSMISMKPVVDAAALVPVYPEMSRLVCHEDVEVQLQVCEALAAVTDGTDATHAPTIFQHFDLSGIASLLTCADSRVCSTGARIVRNLVR